MQQPGTQGFLSLEISSYLLMVWTMNYDLRKIFIALHNTLIHFYSLPL